MENTESLTQNELNVLNMIGEGKTNKEIAQALSTSIRTIETRRKKMMEKTRTTNTATLVKYAVKNQLIS